MTDHISDPPEAPATKRGLRKRTVAIIAAAVIVLAGATTVTSVTIAQAEAEETLRQCTVALDAGATATEAATSSVDGANKALEAVEVTALPETDGWVSTAYADRAGAEAVEAVEASAGVEAVEAVDAIPERPSGAEQIAVVTDASTELANITIADECSDRVEAAEITKVAKETAAAAELEVSTTELTEDFTVFQAEETARIAAEVEAKRLAAEAEAKRLAAEAAARQAAAEEAARQQAAQQSWNSNNNGGSSNNSGGSTPSNNNNSGSRPPASNGGGPPAGGQVGNNGGCVVDNGVGGTRPC